MAESDPFKWRHYQGEIILLCVRWYLRYALSRRCDCAGKALFVEQLSFLNVESKS